MVKFFFIHFTEPINLLLMHKREQILGDLRLENTSSDLPTSNGPLKHARSSLYSELRTCESIKIRGRDVPHGVIRSICMFRIQCKCEEPAIEAFTPLQISVNWLTVT